MKTFILLVLCVTFIQHSTSSSVDEKEHTPSTELLQRVLKTNNNNNNRNKRTNKNDDKKYCNQYFKDYKKQNDMYVSNDDTMEECYSVYKTMQATINSAEQVYESQSEYAKEIYNEEVKAAEEVYEAAIKVADANFKNGTSDFLSDYESAESSAKSTFKSDMNSYISSYFSSYGSSSYQSAFSGSSSGSVVAASGVVGVAAVATVLGVLNRHRNLVASTEKASDGAYTAPNDGLAWETSLIERSLDLNSIDE